MSLSTAMAANDSSAFPARVIPTVSRIPGTVRSKDQRACAFIELLDNRRLNFEFQPIVELRQSSISGYEALMRGDADSDLRSPEVLLDLARHTDRITELERLAVLSAITEFGKRRLEGRLFLNLSASAILDFASDRGSALFEAAVRAGVAPSSLCFELTEHERVEDPDLLAQALEPFKVQGVGLALDDFGDGRSSLRLWAQLEPDIVKLDKFFTRGINQDSRRVDVVRSILALSERFGSRIVVEGLETVEELAVVRDLGCTFGQGYLLGRPAPEPARSVPPLPAQVLASSKIAVLPNTTLHRDIGQTVGRLLIEAPTVAAAASNDEVRRLFSRFPQLHAVAVLEHDYPVGLIDRRSFFDHYAQRYFDELYGRKPCKLFMNPAPFRVERSFPLDSMISMLAGEDQRYLFEGFIITDGGRYAGLATGESLVRAVTERRVEAARHANPLTMLPGNIPITEHISRLLKSGRQFAACYFDLNNFKPFNDIYGYWRGDEMIKLAADTILACTDRSDDFVGHVGGDDFVVLFQSEDWVERCKTIVESFGVRARALFNDEDLGREGFLSEDRHGVSCFFPLTAIAVGAVLADTSRYSNPEDVASSAAAAKKLAKQSADGFHLMGD